MNRYVPTIIIGLNKRSILNYLLVLLLLNICLLGFTSSPSMAETQYVIPSAEIPVRRGQATDYKIVALVTDGTAVEVIERGESYSKIRLANEKEGWILTRFLSDDPPLTEMVDKLTGENEAIRLREQESAQKLELYEQENAQKQQELSLRLAETEERLETANAEKEAITASYEKLKEDTANVVEIKEKMTQTVNENKAINQKIASLTRENDDLKSDERINWFLTGGGVLLLGIIIGKLTSRSKKRKPSLL